MQAIRHVLRTDPMELILPLIVFAVVLAVGWLVRGLVLRALRAWNAHTQSRPGLILLESIRGPIRIWILILAAHLAMQMSTLPARVTEAGAKTLLVLWIISLTLMCMRLAGNLVRYYGDQVPGALPVTTLTQNLAQLMVVILGIVLLMRAIGLEITPILTALGVGGLAVALALQDTLSNLFAGFYVAVARQIRLGDYIKLNTGEEGYVTDIGWRNSSIRALSNNLILIPNAKLSQAIVTNYHLPEKRMGASFQVGVGYDSDLEKVERILLELAKQAAVEVPGMVAEPPPSVTFDPGFGDSALVFTVSFQVAEFANQFAARHELRKRVFRRLKAEGVELPYPTRTVYLHSHGGARPETGGSHHWE